MSSRKSISNTFTVTTLVDGESAPYYFEEKYAWSSDSSTQSVTTPPSISGGWQTSIPPSNGYAYLWRMSIRHVWSESTRSYTQEAAQYFRMSGTNGTSIHIKGHVSTVQKLPTTHADGDAYVVDANGHLYMWSDESGSWVDIGVFQGEAGKTYYTHIAWASQVNYSGTTVTSVDGFITDKSPNDTTHMWMGVYIDEQSGQDESNALRYTWSYTKGNKGDDAKYIYIRGTAINNNAERILNITSTTNIISEYGWQFRGLVAARINRYTLAVSGVTWFDVYGGVSEGGVESAANANAARTRFVTYLTNTTSDYFVAVASQDAIGLNDAMVAKLREFGLGKLDYTAVSDVGGYRTPFAFLGYKGLQQGYALYQLQGDGENDPYAEVMAYVANGIFMSSKDGARGKVGRFFYYAQEWSDDSSASYAVTDAEAPYFKYNDNYWVFNPTNNGTYTMSEMGTPSSSNNNWKLMVTDFKFIITEAIFGSYAHFGSAIINGDWLISTHGKRNGDDSTEYTYFDSNDPMGVSSPSHFAPNFCVDLKKGESYQKRVYASGGMRSPFTYMTSGGSFTTDFNDNVAVYSGSKTSYSLPWDASQSGRKVVVTNYYWNGNYSTATGYAELTAPTGKYFYEDGVLKSTLKLSREGVELLGYGDTSSFYGWIVLKRIDLGTNKRYGHQMKMLAVGRVTSKMDSATISYHSFDGTTLTVTKVANETGKYVISWNNTNWFANANSPFIITTGYGKTIKNDLEFYDTAVFANVAEQTTTSVTIWTADDSSRNNGSFNFFIMNFDDWIYL